MAVRAVKAGAIDFIEKPFSDQLLLDRVRQGIEMDREERDGRARRAEILRRMSLLTQREREVLFYMLSGYSSALTAERLQTTEGTIKIHRKNIHRKLDIGSQAELFSLFIKCIPFASPEAPADPLQAYQSKPATRGPMLR